MAKMILTSDWQTLPVTKGCIQNNSGVSVEVSETNTDNSGQILKSGEALDFENITLYARCTVKNKTSEVRVSLFVTAGGSGSGGSSGGGGTTYILPTASKTIKGGIIVGNNLDINASGVLSATDTTYPQADGLNTGVAKLYSATGINTDGAVTQKLFTSELNKKVDGTSLGTAATHDTGTRVGDVVIVGASGTIDNSLLPAIAINDVHPANSEAAMLALSAHKGDVCIRSDEKKSYILAANPATVKNNWVYLESPSGDVVSVNGKTGVITIDVDKWNSVELNKTTDSASTAYIPFLLTTSANSAKLAKGTVTAELDTFVIRDNDGSVKAKMPVGTVSDDTLVNKKYYDDNMPEGYTLPTASATTLGGIKVGENLSINDEGVLSSNPGSYTLPAASATELGGVKVGSNLTIDGNGVLSADDQTVSLSNVAKSGSYNDLTDTPATYVLPTASKTVKGGILVGDNLDIDSDGKLKANHEPVTMGADTTSTASPKAGEIFTVVDSVVKDSNGHITQINLKTVTMPNGYVLPNASSTVLGGIKVGSNLNINSSGVLNSVHPAITTGNNTTSTACPKAGETFTTIDSVTRDNNGHVTKVNTKTVTLPNEPVIPTKVSELENDSGFVNGDYIPCSGGSLKGSDVRIKMQDDASHLEIHGGDDWKTGSTLYLSGNNHDSQGLFAIQTVTRAEDGSLNNVNLTGKNDGTLTWNRKSVAINSDVFKTVDAAKLPKCDAGTIKYYQVGKLVLVVCNGVHFSDTVADTMVHHAVSYDDLGLPAPSTAMGYSGNLGQNGKILASVWFTGSTFNLRTHGTLGTGSIWGSFFYIAK